MISSTHGLETGDLYTTNGKDVWEVESFCDLPTVTMRNIRTGDVTGGGVGCLNLKPFKKLVEDRPEDKSNPSHHDGAAPAPSVDGVVGSLNKEG